jgi:hypothetical protein
MAAGAAVVTGAVFLAAACAGLFFAAALGATLRAIGRGFGSGTFGLAQAFDANADNPNVSARLVASAVDRNAVAREDGITAVLRGESFNRLSPRSISLNMRTKY